ncbi:ribonuclease [Zhengella mangrovi]|uniref:Ribonuclease n=1 Tax=Zhengella mangrovi TaxID=1982044 RepID=A0A2G1QRY3_9HYPH|nr:ribonuclease [Zhengella mangrovi]PHP68220.1 ribonuclease [Zhengella mangrovi]
MRPLLSTLALLLAAGLAAGCEDSGSSSVDPVQTDANLRSTRDRSADGAAAGDFDFYVLALSWSPSYCKAQGDRADRRQCGRNGPAGFVVHGLWPQKERGYPADCRSSEPDWVPRDVLSSVRDLFPTDGLAAHEWRKHGTCSGLTQRGYFDLTRKARERVRVPPGLGGGSTSPKEVENAFIRSNRGLDADEIAVDCDGQFIREVRICLSTSLDFVACPQVDRSGCRAPRRLMPQKQSGRN